MVNPKADLPQKSSVLQIKQDDKFFCRLLSKESSMSNPSFRVAVAVPFVWESQPGTPKHSFYKDTLPPLTPPPSYHLNTMNACKKPQKKRSRTNLLLALLPKLNLKKMILPSSSSSSLSYDSSFDFKGDNEEDCAGSLISTLCFGIPRAATSSTGLRKFL